MDRRGVLRACALGLASLSGCIGGGTPTPAGGVRSDGTPGPPVDRETPVHDGNLEALFDAAVIGQTSPDDPPSVGAFDAAIDEPSFLQPAAADTALEPGEIVFGVATRDGAKAYPRRILVWHEVVNDVFDGTPITVTYCPLTGSAVTFRRGATTFGMSGKLVNSNLILYDRATESWWPQLLGTAIAGPLAGSSLQAVETVWTTWARWRRRHPDTRVLSEDTGYIRRYGEDPYGSYDPPRGYYAGGPPARTVLHEDDRLEDKTVVVATQLPGGELALEKNHLRERGVVRGAIGDRRYVVTHDPELDVGYVYLTDRRVEGEGSGRARLGGQSYSVDSLPLPRVDAIDVMWFAWVTFYPSTALIADGVR